CLQYASSPYTF
nr:immunoglobulin light chain junction region [Mus musculus]NSL97245.1 immunoglobulin light chain junction region [Mus musculus]NSL97293.1 immunoglobulin light chain junction region [Mus musculus]NSL97498.1 immunoglobulin light chain junction region [Mus musculus]NSL97617.1 immunoglobulin light chain junction region [Mus musculus]